ncbi:unnamed protein product [Sympodiomycopsis kandeliae]
MISDLIAQSVELDSLAVDPGRSKPRPRRSASTGGNGRNVVIVSSKTESTTIPRISTSSSLRRRLSESFLHNKSKSHSMDTLPKESRKQAQSPLVRALKSAVPKRKGSKHRQKHRHEDEHSSASLSSDPSLTSLASTSRHDHRRSCTFQTYEGVPWGHEMGLEVLLEHTTLEQVEALVETPRGTHSAASSAQFSAKSEESEISPVNTASLSRNHTKGKSDTGSRARDESIGQSTGLSASRTGSKHCTCASCLENPCKDPQTPQDDFSAPAIRGLLACANDGDVTPTPGCSTPNRRAMQPDSLSAAKAPTSSEGTSGPDSLQLQHSRVTHPRGNVTPRPGDYPEGHRRLSRMDRCGSCCPIARTYLNDSNRSLSLPGGGDKGSAALDFHLPSSYRNYFLYSEIPRALRYEGYSERSSNNSSYGTSGRTSLARNDDSDVEVNPRERTVSVDAASLCTSQVSHLSLPVAVKSTNVAFADCNGSLHQGDWDSSSDMSYPVGCSRSPSLTNSVMSNSFYTDSTSNNHHFSPISGIIALPPNASPAICSSCRQRSETTSTKSSVRSRQVSIAGSDSFLRLDSRLSSSTGFLSRSSQDGDEEDEDVTPRQSPDLSPDFGPRRYFPFDSDINGTATCTALARSHSTSSSLLRQRQTRSDGVNSALSNNRWEPPRRTQKEVQDLKQSVSSMVRTRADSCNIHPRASNRGFPLQHTFA